MSEEVSPSSATETETLETPQTETVTTSAGNGETPETTTAEQSSSSTSPEDLQAQVKRLEAALKKANSDAKVHRFKNADLEKTLGELKAFKDQTEAEKLTEQQKQELARQNLEKQLSDLQKAHDDAVREKQELRIEHAVAVQATKLGFADPDDARWFLDMAQLEFDESGKPTNVNDLLKDVLASKPYLKANVKAALTSGGATNPPRSQTATSSQPITWEIISKLTPQEYAARRDEIMQFMNNPKNHRR